MICRGVLVAVVIVLGALAGASRAAPDDSDSERAAKNHPPPAEPSVLLPWKVGQWATYRVTKGADESTVKLRIVAEDDCGFWIDVAVLDSKHHVTTRTCVTRTQVPGIAEIQQMVRVLSVRVDGNVAKVIDLGDAAADRSAVDALKLVLAAEWSGRSGLRREDVATPAGKFIALEEKRGQLTRWSHPAVPITGLVRETEAGQEVMLLDFGQAPLRSVILEDNQRLLAQAKVERERQRPHRKWFGVSFGNGMLGTADDATYTTSFGVTVGYRPRRPLAVVADFTESGFVPYLPMPMLAESLGRVVVGVRWFPYDRWARVGARPVFDLRQIYLQAEGGYAQLERGLQGMETSVVGRGGTAGVRLGLSTGWLDWKLALEIDAHSALLNSDEGLRFTFGLNAIIELYMP